MKEARITVPTPHEIKNSQLLIEVNIGKTHN